jgi:TP901 family phage tail tape measure protein
MVKPIILPISYKSDPKGLRRAENDLKGFASGVGKAIAGATAAVAGIGIASVKAFADFDGAMNKSLAIMGDVSDTLRGDMSDAAREVAKTTTFSADQAAESYFFLASAGLDAEASIGALPAVANFAQAGMFDMAQATDLLTDAQSALGLTSDDTGENLENMIGLSDVLVKANTLANASVAQFSEALTNKAGASMNALNMEMEEGVAVLAVFADQGIKGSQAGTTFNAAIRGLTNGALNNAEAFDRLGIEVFDSEGAMNNMADIVGDLEGSLGHLSVEEQRAELAALGFTEETLAGTLALIGNSDALRDYEKDLRDAGGTTDEVAGKQLQTFSAQLGLLGSAVNDVGIRIGDELGPTMEGLVEQLGPVVDEVGDVLVEAFKSLAPVIADVAKELPGIITALTPMIPIIVDIAKGVFEVAVALLPVFLGVLQALLPIIQGFTALIVDNSDKIAGLVITVGALVLAFQAFNTIARISQLATLAFGAAKGVAAVAVKAFNLALKANPIGIVITLIAALIAGLVFFFTQTELGREAWNRIVEAFQIGIAAIGGFFTNLFTVVIPEILAAFFLGVTAVWDGIKDAFFAVFDFVSEGFKSYINGWIGLIEGFVNLFIRGINSIIGAFNRLSITIPEWAPGGPRSFGVNIPRASEISLPRLAEGGIVNRETMAIIGEAGPEAVIPLDKLGKMGGSTINITVNAGVGTNGSQVGEQIVNAIRKYERTSGPVFARA